MKSGSPPRQRTLRPLVISWLLAGITSGNTNSPTLMMAERAAQWMVEAQRAGG